MGTQSCKTIIQKYFDVRLSSGFSEQLIDAVNEIGPLVSHVIQNSGFNKSTVQNAFFIMLGSNKKVAMPACYCKKKLALLSDWSTVLGLTSLNGAAGKSWNYF